MRKLLALVVLFLAIVSTCCAPHVAQPRGPEPAIVEVKAPAPRPSRTVAITLHVDTAFTGAGRVLILEAASRWERITRDRVSIDLEFDLTVENLEEHVNAGDSFLIGVRSDTEIVNRIDEVLDNGNPLSKPVAATIVPQSHRPIMVFLIVDRIPAAKFLAVVTHELGHVLGLPDLEAQGAIMSGSAKEDDAPVEDFTPADVALCRASHLCD